MYYYNTFFGKKMQGIRKQIGLSRDTVYDKKIKTRTGGARIGGNKDVLL